MWHIETEQLQSKKETMILKITVEHGLFESYLAERQKLYPAFINYNTNWFKMLNPYQPFVSPFPGIGSSRIRVGKPITIKFPHWCGAFNQEKYQQAVVKQLFKWLNEEYKLFQKKWTEGSEIQ